MRHQSAQIAATTPPKQHRRRPRWAARALASTAVASSLLLGTLPAQAVPMNASASQPVSGMNQSFKASNGVKLNYHYYADGVDFSRPVGAVFFFDGDGTTRFNSPKSVFAARMAQQAAASNRVFIFVQAPNAQRSWYAGDMNRTTGAVRQFISQDVLPTLDKSVLLSAYSGGAEFVVGGLLSRGIDQLPENSGALLVGGGGTYGQRLEPAKKSTDDFEFTWVVGKNDGKGATFPKSWSAKDVTARAQKDFSKAGYRESHRRVVNGNHHSYDIPALLGPDLKDLDR